MKKVTIEEFERENAVRPEAQRVDVREPAEHAQAKLAGFDLHPLSSLSEASLRGLDKARTTYLLCRSGARACLAAEKLEKLGFADVRVIEGGLGAFEAAGRPVQRGASRVWALERQVRFAAGALVLAGVVLAAALHPAWVLLSAFVGAGLVFSAVTDTCGMALCLARMPWNRRA